MGDEYHKIQLIMSLRNQGIRDTHVLRAMETIPRGAFVAEPFQGQAYADQSLPIECGQTISQPYVVALMTQKLNVTDRCKVLEIGTGSGYQAAILSKLCRRVYTMERYRTLSREAERRFAALRLGNITAMVGDGAKGWPQQAPFDRIIVTAASTSVPPALVGQLKDGGIMVMPLEREGGEQELIRLTRHPDGLDQENLLPVRFVPLVQGIAKEL
ncbi:MAG: protein-L-isoaspartate(D-aspartate) O-methyltransferase [Hyphomicrobiales bacterium]